MKIARFLLGMVRRALAQGLASATLKCGYADVNPKSRQGTTDPLPEFFYPKNKIATPIKVATHVSLINSTQKIAWKVRRGWKPPDCEECRPFQDVMPPVLRRRSRYKLQTYISEIRTNSQQKSTAFILIILCQKNTASVCDKPGPQQNKAGEKSISNGSPYLSASTTFLSPIM
jgi:hypothetical protein